MTYYPPKTVLYIPGFLSGDDSQAKMLHALSRVFPSTYGIYSLPWEMKNTDEWHFPWESEGSDSFSGYWNRYLSKAADVVNSVPFDSNGVLSKALLLLTIIPRWGQAVESARIASRALAESLLRLTDQKREKIILVGHSLGADIVIRTLYRLYTNNACIWKAVLLGAAMKNNDRKIRPACNGVKDRIISVINTEDYALGLYSMINSQDALGRGYSGLIDRQRYLEIATDPVAEHASLFYLQQLRKKAKSA